MGVNRLMNKYNYWYEVANDVYCWMDSNLISLSQFDNREQAADWLYDELWAESNVTGNGTFWYSTEEKCEEYICHNIDLAFQACEDFGLDFKDLRDHFSKNDLARYLDCTIRCYVLTTSIYDALKEKEQTEKYGTDI